jgi:hypothetical protein
MICARCDKPIKGQPRPVEKFSASGAGGTVYVCPVPCQPAPRQTAPTRRVRRRSAGG